VNKKLYVGSLSYDTTDDTLREAFSAHGKVLSADVIKDNYSGRSKGFGFVEMETTAEAEAAVNALNGTTLDGRQITVAEARPPRERSDRGERSGGYGTRGGGGGGRRDRW